MKTFALKIACISLLALLALPAPAQKKFTHPWQNKKVAYFGDSVTDPTAPGGKRYWQVLKEELGITPLVYAVNGRQWNDIPRQTDQLNKEHGQDVDAILIFMGTNDYNASVPIGKWFNEVVETVESAAGLPRAKVQRKRRVPVMDNATMCGRINIAMEKLKTMYPDKQIVLLTPIHRAFAEFGKDNVQPSEQYQNAAGEWFSDYVEAVRQAGRIWSVPVIDLYSVSGLMPILESNSPYISNTTTDRLHPSAKGHNRIAKTLMYQLLALPCTF